MTNKLPTLSQIDVIQLFEWYSHLESRLGIMLDVIPLSGKRHMKSFVTPRLVPILVEAASITDTVLRSLFPNKAIRPNGKNITRKGANIYDFHYILESKLRLTQTQSLVMSPEPFILSPFAGWRSQYPHSVKWWTAYNRLKHSRLQWAGEATLLNTLQSICALQQLMTKIPEVLLMSLRFGWIKAAGWNPEVLLESTDQAEKGNLGRFLTYTKFFCTPLAPTNWSSVSDVSPVYFDNIQKLIDFLGRMT